MANSQGAVARTSGQPARTDRPANRPMRMNDPTRMLQTDFDRTFDRFSRLFDIPRLLDLFGPSSDLTSALGDETVPRVDVRDLPDAVEVTAELPGVNEPGIDISIGDQALTLRAQTEEERETDEGGYRIRERTIGRIERVIPLQTAGLDADKATASFRNGLLTIRIPKKPEARTEARRIRVDAGQQSSGQQSSGQQAPGRQSSRQ
ncbi:MAG: Hsp20/alpha crystallin family protein [Rhodomicrobium sp.]